MELVLLDTCQSHLILFLKIAAETITTVEALVPVQLSWLKSAFVEGAKAVIRSRLEQLARWVVALAKRY